ncbi:MAG: hypothetical protein ACLR1A_09535 [Eubacterium ventriosum]
MDKKGTSVFSNSLIWFGAGVSIAEIVTGTYLASLEWQGNRSNYYRTSYRVACFFLQDGGAKR